jgi:hypothetical protein
MTLREFTDKRGVTWRVWDITPESLRGLSGQAEYPTQHHPVDFYRTGWLSFQTLSGTDKRTLSPIPPGWESLSVAELADMLERATSGVPRGSGRAHAASTPAQEIRVRGVVRAFVYPGGRAWTVCLAIPEQGEPPVLRFSSGGRAVDLAKWPADWKYLPDESLIDLLRSVPRAGAAPDPGRPRRRWNDPRPGGPGR